MEEDIVGEVVVVEVDVVVEPLGLVVVVLVSVVVVVVDGRSMGTLSSIEKSLSLR